MTDYTTQAWTGLQLEVRQVADHFANRGGIAEQTLHRAKQREILALPQEQTKSRLVQPRGGEFHEGHESVDPHRQVGSGHRCFRHPGFTGQRAIIATEFGDQFRRAFHHPAADPFQHRVSKSLWRVKSTFK